MAKSEIYNNESLHKAERKEMIRECRKDKMKIMAEKILIITGGTVDYEWAKDWLSGKHMITALRQTADWYMRINWESGWITFWGITIRLMKGCLIPIKKIRRQ